MSTDIQQPTDSLPPMLAEGVITTSKLQGIIIERLTAASFHELQDIASIFDIDIERAEDLGTIRLIAGEHVDPRRRYNGTEGGASPVYTENLYSTGSAPQHVAYAELHDRWGYVSLPTPDSRGKWVVTCSQDNTCEYADGEDEPFYVVIAADGSMTDTMNMSGYVRIATTEQFTNHLYKGTNNVN